MKVFGPEYTVRQAEKDPQAFGNYNYEIYKDGSLVARFWHDYRGDELGITFMDGRALSAGANATTFLTGGGRLPLGLTAHAIQFIEEHLR